jgi:metal-dependent amidase/aminoacylase/carboxypeptidase family protein
MRMISPSVRGVKSLPGRRTQGRIVKRPVIVLLIALVLCATGCRHTTGQHIQHAPAPTQTVQSHTNDIFDDLVAIRRDIHAHPELAGSETRTSALIAARLRKLGLEVQTGHHGHSVVGVLRGAYPGKTVAWRADMDALPGEFPDPAPFKSKTLGVHHACGHDVHITIALGIAEILAKRRDSLHGTAVFLFQPEEETFRGAKGMIERGVFATTMPDEVYGLHVTAFPVGQIVVRAGEMFAHERRVRVRMQNRLSATEIEGLKTRLHDALWRTQPGAKPWEIPNAVDPIGGLTVPTTSFQDYLIIGGTFDARIERDELLLEANLYETNASNIAGIIPRIEQAVDTAGYKSALRSVSFLQANPTVLNDPKLTELAIRTLKQARGEDAVKRSFGQVPFFNDDFAYFQQRAPGVYFFLGGSNVEKGIIAMNHAPDFQVDEGSVRVGVESFSSLMLARLGINDANQ